MVCGQKELKKLVDISGQLVSVKRVIWIDDAGVSNGVSSEDSNTNWKIASFSEVKTLGRENPTEADLPASSDIAVIMYTSGSTGLPKVCLRYSVQSVNSCCLLFFCDAGCIYRAFHVANEVGG